MQVRDERIPANASARGDFDVRSPITQVLDEHRPANASARVRFDVESLITRLPRSRPIANRLWPRLARKVGTKFTRDLVAHETRIRIS
jgi:hypothetical protein